MTGERPMRAEDTAPDLFPPLPAEPEGTDSAQSTEESRLRPLDRRILQAIALLCAVPALLALHWVDENNNVEKNLKPPEKIITVPPGEIGEFLGARWKVFKRETSRPPAGDALQGSNDGTELRLSVAVRPGDAASAKTVGSYGLVYRFVGEEGREWSASGTSEKKPQAGVAMLIIVKGTVPRAKADSLELQLRPPKTSRKEGEPQLLLRFEQ